LKGNLKVALVSNGNWMESADLELINLLVKLGINEKLQENY
jgi:hypothetical protein